MNKGRAIRIGIAAVLLVPGILDGIRYLKPDTEEKQAILPAGSFPVSAATELILVYNAYGGYYPGLVDIVHKEFFPNSYPCNLCYQAFGTFGMRDEWKTYLDSLPLKVTKLYKDEFRRRYMAETMPLPLILTASENQTQVLLSAEKLNQLRSPESMLRALQTALTPANQ